MITTDYCSTEIPQLSYYEYEITTVSQEDEDTYTYTITKERSYSTKTKKQKIPENLEWSNSMFKGFKEWQNKMLSEQIENKDKYIVLYKECISVIAECKQTISE